MNRRELMRFAALGSLSLALPSTGFAHAGTAAKRRRPRGPAALDAGAGLWQTWLAPSVKGLLPVPPPKNGSAQTRQELAELRQLENGRTDAVKQAVAFWDPQGGVLAWTQILLDTIKATNTNPVLASRAMALLHTAIADAAIAAWYAKFQYRRAAPARLGGPLTSLSEVDLRLPSYPSEHAAIAAAAAMVLNYLYPAHTLVLNERTVTFDGAANEAALSRLWAGANYRSDLDPGFLIGQAIGLMAVQRGSTDGSAATWDTATQPGRLTGPQYWVPTPPANAFPPLLPLAGRWNPWLLSSGDQFRPPAPPALQEPFPSDAFLQETNEVYETVVNLRSDQLHIANFWADGAGTFTPPGHWLQFAAQHVDAANLSTPRAARALALVAVGEADSAIACWDCKFAYWIMRPITAIRTLSGQPFYDPTFVTPVVTPPFPAYSSGHSTFSGCAAKVLHYLFPNGSVPDAFGQNVPFDSAANQAAESRLYGGIHYRSDNDEGLFCGRRIADLVIARAQRDG